jgi:hypothetical protein
MTCRNGNAWVRWGGHRDLTYYQAQTRALVLFLKQIAPAAPDSGPGGPQQCWLVVNSDDCPSNTGKAGLPHEKERISQGRRLTPLLAALSTAFSSSRSCVRAFRVCEEISGHAPRISNKGILEVLPRDPRPL